MPMIIKTEVKIVNLIVSGCQTLRNSVYIICLIPHFGSSSHLASVLSGDFKLHLVKYLFDCLDSLEISLDVSNAPAIDLVCAIFLG